MGKKLTKSLFSQRDTLQLLQPIFLSRTIYHSILQQFPINAMMIDRTLNITIISSITVRLQLPRISLLVMNQSGIIIPFV